MVLDQHLISPNHQRPSWTGILVTFVAYVCVHAGRKAFTNTKSIAVDYLGLDPETAGTMDAIFMLSYAIGLVTLGGLGDSRNPLGLLAMSLLLMSVFQSTFVELCIGGYSEWLLILVWSLNGLVQSLAWPCCVKLVQYYLNSYPRQTTVFSFWACNGIVGNIVSSLIAELIVQRYSASIEAFRLIFTTTSLLNVAACALVLCLSYSPSPRSLSVGSSEGKTSITDTLKIRGVLDYSLCHLCIKGVAYAMFFWLPFYLTKVHHVDAGTAASVSIVYDVATAIGGPICGLLVEKTNKPAFLICLAVLFAAGPQFLINSTSDTTLWNLFMSQDDQVPYGVILNIVFSGFFVGGVLNILSAAICVSVGGSHGAARVTGVIDGFGSIGASATQIFVPMVSVGGLGWTGVFSLLGVLLIISALTLVRIVRDEFNVYQFN